MNILFCTSHLPYPPYSGGRLREYEILKRLSRFCDIYLCVITKTYKEDLAFSKDIRGFVNEITIFPCQDMTQSEEMTEEFPEQVIRNSSRRAAEYIQHLLATGIISVIHLEGFYMYGIIPLGTKIPIILIEQNIEYRVYFQKYRLASNSVSKSHYLRQYYLTKKFELNVWREVSGCITLTVEDKKIIENSNRAKFITVVPNGSNHLTSGTRLNNLVEKDIRSPSILYIGNFAYYPNVDAANYFFETMYYSILSDVPNAHIYFVGNDPNKSLDKFKTLPNVYITGEVESLEEYYSAADLVICPLRIGGGIKVKLLEALSMGKAIVSTSVGLQGLNHFGESNLVAIDDARKFSESVVRVLLDINYKSELEQQATNIASKLPKWESTVNELYTLYQKVAFN